MSLYFLIIALTFYAQVISIFFLCIFLFLISISAQNMATLSSIYIHLSCTDISLSILSIHSFLYFLNHHFLLYSIELTLTIPLCNSTSIRSTQYSTPCITFPFSFYFLTRKYQFLLISVHPPFYFPFELLDHVDFSPIRYIDFQMSHSDLHSLLLLFILISSESIVLIFQKRRLLLLEVLQYLLLDLLNI